LKIAWVVDVWPPRSSDGESARSLARDLAALGNEILIFAGALESPAEGDPRAHVLSRPDAHRTHWQRSASVSIDTAFRALLRAERPDVVHVHHWRSLSRDLVFGAALEGRPAVVSLHDPWMTCLVGTRLLPRTGAACDAVLAAHPCIACAPRTPWVPIEAQYMAFAEHKLQLVRELKLARAVIARDRTHATETRRFLGDEVAALAPFIEADSFAGGGARTLAEIYADAVSSGAPDVGRARAGDWYTERMKAFAETEWERGAQAAGFHS
jgi:hypothetical protein